MPSDGGGWLRFSSIYLLFAQVVEAWHGVRPASPAAP